MKKLLLAGAAIGSGAVVYQRAIRPWWLTWGVDPHDTGRALPGDDLVPGPTSADTRSIEIDAPPSDVWPWLLQMGYGRAGWYSYDSIDMAGASSRRVVPEWQTLKVGDVVPTHPGGGFEVRVADAGHALVLYTDTAIVANQAEAAQEKGIAVAAPNVEATGTLLAATQPTDFAASWTFVLEATDQGRTRLIERFRVRFGESDKPWTALTLPVIGFGVFLMTRKQMLGIRDRAEVLRRSGRAAPSQHENGSSATPIDESATPVVAVSL